MVKAAPSTPEGPPNRLRRLISSNLDNIVLTEDEAKSILPIEGQFSKFIIWRKWMLTAAILPYIISIVLQCLLVWQTGKWTRSPGAALKNGIIKINSTNLVSQSNAYPIGAASVVSSSDDLPLTHRLDQFVPEWARYSLADAASGSSSNQSSFNETECEYCDDCNACPSCDFCNCEECEDCYDCPYCEGCEFVCEECTDCYDCSNCDQCSVCATCQDDDCPKECFQDTYNNDDIYEQNFGIKEIAKFDKGSNTKKFLLASNIINVIIMGISATFYILALYFWKSFHKSARLILLSWGISFTIPFLIHLLPIASIIFNGAPTLKSMDQPDFKYIVAMMSVRLVFAFESYVKISPASLALIPALTKACTCMKCLLPQSPFLGFIIKGLRFMKIPIFLSLFIFLYQIASDYFICAVVVSLTMSQLVFIIPFKKKGITKPFKTGQEVSDRMIFVMRLSLLFFLIAAIFLGLFFVNLSFNFVGFDKLRRIKWAAISNFIPIPNPLTIAKIIIDFVVKFFIATVTFADLMMWVLQKIHVYSRDFPELITTYNQHMDSSLLKYVSKKERRANMEVEMNYEVTGIFNKKTGRFDASGKGGWGSSEERQMAHYFDLNTYQENMSQKAQHESSHGAPKKGQYKRTKK
eukprot:gene2492-2836_t